MNRLALLGVPLYLGMALSVPVQAQPSVEADQNLRALRMAEVELFGHAPAPSDAQLDGLTPPSLQRALRPPSQESASGSRDLSWLQDLELPDLPIRWDDRVVRFLEFFRNDPRGQSIIRGWMRRERRYGPEIREQLRELGAPEDLLYVAMVESGLNPTARSGAGAVGLWQFVRATGEEYGLHRTHWEDGRMNPRRATEAGVRYLQDLRRRFGTWDLAFAAYNMGLGALLRSMRKYNTNDYWLLANIEAGLPFETTLYVAKIMACAIVGRNPDRFQLGDLSGIEAQHTQGIRVPGGTNLRRLANLGSIELSELEALNPQLRRGRVPPGEASYEIRVLAERSEALTAAWNRVRVRQANTRDYAVLFGEGVSEVARRFRTSSSRIRDLNELEEGDELTPGSIISVPDVEPRARAEQDTTVVTVPDRNFVVEGRRRVFYRVTRNDTLAQISEFFQVTQDELLVWNRLSLDATLPRGLLIQLFVDPELDLSQALVLTEDDVRLLSLGSEEFFEFHEEQNGRVRHRYIISEGDTLRSIAERFGLRRVDLSRINAIGHRTALTPGETIIVYTTPDRVPAAASTSEPRETQSDEDADSEAASSTAPAADSEETTETTPPVSAQTTGDADSPDAKH